ncbi:MAG: DUF2752 domain-containing protein [Candidatus Eremiobacteraeota bacterium]|nr:DUF2752 domain-containing protein [Candidatus Eremiobacteraeota bacterium]
MKTRDEDGSPPKIQAAAREPVIPALISWGALAVLLLSFLIPSGFFKHTLCTFKVLTGLPCPGCGISRSILQISHGHFIKAFRFNPMGFPVYLFLIFCSFYNFIPQEIRDRVDSFLLRHKKACALASALFVALLLALWTIRLVMQSSGSLIFLDAI